MTETADKQIQLKNYSRISLLNYIRRNNQVTKARLASVTGLTFMAVKKILEELIKLNLVREYSYQNGGVGRRAVTYTVNENYAYTVGLHINVFRTSAAVMDLQGKILEKETAEAAQASSQAELVEQISSLVERVIEKSGVCREKLLGLGVGAPGPVNSQEGVVLSPPNFPLLRYLPLKHILEERLRLPVFLQKDTNAIAMGEYWRGAGAGCSDMVYIEADMGIGSSFILNGATYEGANYIAGEFGHITLDLNGPVCNCGGRGCLEAVGSGLALLRQMKEQLAELPGHPLYEKRAGLTIEDLMEMARKNDPLTISTLNKAAFYMGAAVSNLINILDPQLIILGGILTMEYPQYYRVVRDATLSKRVQGTRENVIVQSALGGRAGVIGAGEIVANNFYTTLVNQVLTNS